MTDRDLGVALTHVKIIEQQARDRWTTATLAINGPERDDALKVVRQAIALRNVIERWITGRVERSAQQREA